MDTLDNNQATDVSQSETPAADIAAVQTPPVAAAAASTGSPEGPATAPEPADKTTLGDTQKVTLDPPADTVTLAAPAEEIEQIEPVIVDDNDAENDEHVASLRIQLAAFSKAVMRPGNKPEDFKAAAKLAVQFTKYVVQYPKVPVLNALLAFFEENIDGACAATNYMKGSTTVPTVDERQVGYLYNLFADLANQTLVRINNSQVINVLKKQEIAEFYNRRMTGIRQAREASFE